MDAITAGLIGATIGAIAGISGNVISNIFSKRNDRIKWLRLKKEEAYSNSIKYLVRIKNKNSKLSVASGELIPILEQEHIKELFDEIAEVKLWLMKTYIYANKKYKNQIKKLYRDITGNSIMDIPVSPDRNLDIVAIKQKNVKKIIFEFNQDKIQEAIKELSKFAEDDLLND